MRNYFKTYAFIGIGLIVNTLFFSCEEENFESTETGIEVPFDDYIMEEAYPQEAGKRATIILFGVEVEADLMDDGMYKIGDMLFNESQLNIVTETSSVKSVGRTGARWSDNTVYYSIESGLANQSRVTDAIAHWEANTDLRFIQRTDQNDYVYFRTGSGCSSSVGRVGGRQNINLATNCSTGNTIHEIGHAVGLWHEQSRKDRDDDIRINFDNISSGTENNFRTYVERGNDGDEYTSDLDFGSVMMYSSFAFSSNGNPTIVKLDGSTFRTQRDGLSSGDISGISQMYPPITTGNSVVDILGSNGKYVSSEDGRRAMNCNRDSARTWELFEVIPRGNGKVALKGNNGRYVSSENGEEPMTCNSVQIGNTEEFTLISRGGDVYAIQGNNGRFVSSEFGTKPMICDRTSIREWEEFVISGL